MNDILIFFAISCAIQLAHSLEEIFTHFEEKWPLWKMTRLTFVSFEIVFSIVFLYVVIFNPSFELVFAKAFLLIMFANGIWHIFWAGSVKKYVPGLITAPMHLINSAIYFLL